MIHRPTAAARVDAAVRTLVDRYRRQCLWFLDPQYYPASPREVMRVLDYIERYGDRAAFARAAEIRQWLSQSSSETSAIS